MKLETFTFDNDFYHHDIGIIHVGRPTRLRKTLKKLLSKARRRDGKKAIALREQEGYFDGLME
jgi:hypothetical protein